MVHADRAAHHGAKNIKEGLAAKTSEDAGEVGSGHPAGGVRNPPSCEEGV
jgi:hypothetical protein